MKRRTLGKTDVVVSELGLGTCFMSGQGQQGVNDCVARAVDRGINYFDTAADYGKGNDERMIGVALRGRRDKVFLATKVGGVGDFGSFGADDKEIIYTPTPGGTGPVLVAKLFENFYKLNGK